MASQGKASLPCLALPRTCLGKFLSWQVADPSSEGVDVTKLLSSNDENESSEESNEAQTDSSVYYFYEYRKRRSVEYYEINNKLVSE